MRRVLSCYSICKLESDVIIPPPSVQMYLIDFGHILKLAHEGETEARLLSDEPQLLFIRRIACRKQQPLRELVHAIFRCCSTLRATLHSACRSAAHSI